MQTFIYKKIDKSDTKTMQKIYALRYQVYCNECGFIEAKDYPDQMESDEYDDQSIHFAAINQDDEVAGTMRIILPGSRVLPIQKYCPNIKIDHNVVPQITYAEISRLVISKNIRRRKDDGRYYGPQVEDTKGTDSNGVEYMRRAKPMAFGIYRELYLESKRLGITHWYSLMEKSLSLLLRIHGFAFECIGEEVDVYGPVCPYLGKVEHIEKEVAKKFPKFFEYFTSQADTSRQ